MANYIDADKLKAEIERRIKILREDEVVRQNCTSDFLEGKIYGYEEVLSFLSTLESEKPIDIDFEQELYKHFGQVKDFTLGMRIGKFFYELGKQSRPKISDNSLEEEIAGMYQAIFGTDIINRKEMVYLDTFEAIARHFAKWGADHTPLPEDTVLFNKGVEEGKRLAEEEQADFFTIVALDAAQRAKEQMMKDGLDAVKSGQSNKIEKTIAGVFVKYGMDRQKEQMMKEAVEGTVYGNGDYTWVAGDIPSQFKYGDKVRVIVCKKESEK